MLPPSWTLWILSRYVLVLLWHNAPPGPSQGQVGVDPCRIHRDLPALERYACLWTLRERPPHSDAVRTSDLPVVFHWSWGATNVERGQSSAPRGRRSESDAPGHPAAAEPQAEPSLGWRTPRKIVPFYTSRSSCVWQPENIPCKFFTVFTQYIISYLSSCPTRHIVQHDICSNFWGPNFWGSRD